MKEYSVFDLLSGVPRFDIEVSLKCNINCVMCPRDKITRPGSFMTPRLMNALLGWLPDIESEIFLCGLGEPILNSDIYTFIKKFQTRKNITGITSNGMLLTPQTIDRLIKASVNFIHISVPSLIKEVYEKIMVGSTFEKVQAHLKYLSQAKPAKLLVDLAFTEQRENSLEIERIKAFARQLDFGFQHNVLHSRGGHLSQIYKPHADSGIRGCAVFARNHFITSEGDILACCHDLQGKTRLGSINNISFNELLKIKQTQIIENQQFDICSGCDDINRFKFWR